MIVSDWIIIVDDNATDLQIAESALKNTGINTTLLKTGRELLDYLQQSASVPDLLLINIFMRDMDGFEILKAVRHLKDGRANIPVIFLSTDEAQASETNGLRLGAIDYIHKPINPDILTRRVQNALQTQKKLVQLERNAMIDRMTGFLNKDTVEDRMEAICQVETGFLCVLDLDSFKLFNDIYGHDVGDRVIVMFSDLLKNNMRSEDICGRIGGDEFLLFAKNMRTENELRHFTERINRDYLEMMNQLFEGSLKFPTGVSIGAAAVPVHGRIYRELFHLADQALGIVKQTGKGGCALSGSPQIDTLDPSDKLNLETVTRILEERCISPNAMWMGREAFINIYRYMMRYMERYQGVAYRVLFTVTPCERMIDSEQHIKITTEFRRLIQKSLRNSDVMVEVSNTQIFLLLPETHEMGVNIVIDRLINNWNLSQYHNKAKISWEAGPVHLAGHESSEYQHDTQTHDS
jgi:diguanylate cyclase (GGDEF)-like protein